MRQFPKGRPSRDPSNVSDQLFSPRVWKVCPRHAHWNHRIARVAGTEASSRSSIFRVSLFPPFLRLSRSSGPCVCVCLYVCVYLELERANTRARFFHPTSESIFQVAIPCATLIGSTIVKGGRGGFQHGRDTVNTNRGTWARGTRLGPVTRDNQARENMSAWRTGQLRFLRINRRMLGRLEIQRLFGRRRTCLLIRDASCSHPYSFLPAWLTRIVIASWLHSLNRIFSLFLSLLFSTNARRQRNPGKFTEAYAIATRSPNTLEH